LREARTAAARATAEVADGAEADGTRSSGDAGAAGIPRGASDSSTDGGTPADWRGLADATPATTARNNGWGVERPARGTRIWLESRQRRPDLGDQGGGALALHAAMAVARALIRDFKDSDFKAR
jgi:hypothetical protein